MLPLRFHSLTENKYLVQRRTREASELLAKKVSDEIDRALEAERRSYEKHTTRILLLGERISCGRH
jgi:hypothetical protein